VDRADYVAQFETAMQVRDSINVISRTLDDLELIRTQVEQVMEQIETTGGNEELDALADSLTSRAIEITRALQQTSNESGQDPIRFEPQLDNQLLELYGRLTAPDGYISGGADGAPQAGTMERLEILMQEWGAVRSDYIDLLQNELQRFNQAVEQLGLPAVSVPVRVRIIS
jgi:hypothetical protein